MKLIALLVSLALGFATSVYILPAESANPPPVCCGQVNPDIYEVSGWPSPTLQTLNPLTQRLKAGGRQISFAYVVMPGCSDGNMRQTLSKAMDSSTRVTGIVFIESANPDLTIRANCGVSFTNICGSGAIACLGRGWPYVNDIDASTQMASFFELSQISIWEHELMGHAASTANEGYKLGGSFAATPGFVSYMNTGPDSRHDWPENDVNRWWRTMWQPLTIQTCEGETDQHDNVWDSCKQRWVAPNGWLYNPARGEWELAGGTLEWSACSAQGHRYSPHVKAWFNVGHGFFSPERGFWSFAPDC